MYTGVLQTNMIHCMSEVEEVHYTTKYLHRKLHRKRREREKRRRKEKEGN